MIKKIYDEYNKDNLWILINCFQSQAKADPMDYQDFLLVQIGP